MKINFYGDLCPTKSNIELLKAGDYDKVFGPVSMWNKDVDVSVVNLECALGEKTSLTEKSGPSMRAPIECIAGLVYAGFNIVSVANNHSLDNGIEAFENELCLLEEAGLKYVGTNLKNNRKDYVVVGEDAEKTAILSIGDHEYNTDENGYGVNVFVGFKTYSSIINLKKEFQNVVVIYHSGYENAVYPSPKLMERCRTMVDCGASAVLCQHSHCIGTYEEYNGSLILYGQGNFLFDLTERNSWHRGLCVRLTVNKDGMTYSFEPLAVSNGCATELSEDDKTSLMNEFVARSEEISNPQSIKNKWNEFLKNEVWKYNAMFKGGSKVAYVVCKLTSMITNRLLLSKKQTDSWLLFLRSDTHTEALSDLLQMERSKKK